MSCEPVLRADDLAIWETWQRTALVHARTRAFSKRLDRARTTTDEAVRQIADLAIMWSGGKDSTAMTHIIRVVCGHDLPAYSEKDDLDYPGETEYVERLAWQWGLRLKVLTPDQSLQEWMTEQAEAGTLGPADEDFHGRAAALSKEHFYDLVESASRQHGGIFLGLRKNESAGRMRNRASRGTLYRKKSGQWVCTPIADWSGLDVMAYLASHEIPVLDVYRCIGFMHRDEPWRVRKSWWIPGAHTRWGGIAWLRRYYPSLYHRLCRWMPDARMHA